jgi:hypothetical protein
VSRFDDEARWYRLRAPLARAAERAARPRPLELAPASRCHCLQAVLMASVAAGIAWVLARFAEPAGSAVALPVLVTFGIASPVIAALCDLVDWADRRSIARARRPR